MVAGRAHQGIGERRAVQHLFRCRQRAVDGLARGRPGVAVQRREGIDAPVAGQHRALFRLALRVADRKDVGIDRALRSEEHTSELQSLMRISYAVFCLKNKTTSTNIKTTQYSYIQL